jgi:choline dehydrogenase-like flavoprotein
MPVQKLCDLADGTVLDADIVIVGGGACGLTLARSLSGRGLKVVIVESGGQTEDADHEQLNAVEMPEGLWSKFESDLRDKYHRNLTKLWNGETQPYGVRCRGLGGATQAWAGKSAPFEKVDFAVRDWVPNSGWPISAESLEPYIERASELLNLGPRIYDETLWKHMGRRPPEPTLSTGTFRTMFWQFARSRRTPTDIIRFGADFLADPPSDVHVLTNATVTRLLSNDDGTAFVGLEAKSLTQRSVTIRAASCVLAASAIENARLLLVSRDADPAGLGNKHDCVGRYLMDHPTATVGRAQSDQIADMAARFGLTGLREKGRTYVYMHGLGLSEAYQRANKALNGAVFVTEERASDDPFSALRRLLRRRSDSIFGDVLSVIRSPMRLARGATARAVERGYLPKAVTRFIVDVALRLFPNTVAQDYQNGTLPLKLSGLRFEATTEQPPDWENRVTLSDSVDVFGVPRARIFWRPGAAARANLHRIGIELSDCFSAAGVARPILEDWVAEGSPDAGVVIDLGHSMGTTRMSDSPQTGVVDRNCAVHGVSGLFAAGGSVFTTSGHANPTLMMLALTLRLSDTLTQKHTAI